MKYLAIQFSWLDKLNSFILSNANGRWKDLAWQLVVFLWIFLKQARTRPSQLSASMHSWVFLYDGDSVQFNLFIHWPAVTVSWLVKLSGIWVKCVRQSDTNQDTMLANWVAWVIWIIHCIPHWLHFYFVYCQIILLEGGSAIGMHRAILAWMGFI